MPYRDFETERLKGEVFQKMAMYILACLTTDERAHRLTWLSFTNARRELGRRVNEAPAKTDKAINQFKKAFIMNGGKP